MLNEHLQDSSFVVQVLNLPAEALDGRDVVAADDDGRRVIRHLPLGLGVYPRHLEVLEDHIHQPIQVPLVVGGDWAVVRDLVENVELLPTRRGCGWPRDISRDHATMTIRAPILSVARYRAYACDHLAVTAC